MTREQAIELLEDVIGFIEDNQGRDYDTAFRMAIEALSAGTIKFDFNKYRPSVRNKVNDGTPSADAVQVAYVCDSRACNGDCTSEECTHTKDIEHAKNFIRIGDAYMEQTDVESVVRCKDCKWYDNRDVCHNPRYGDGHANYSPPYVDEEYWCKDAERREP